MKSRKIPSFLLKLYSILENENFSNVVHWKENGKSFAIVNFNRFIDEVLPSYYKHKNFASFVRQLNMYDFHKERAKVDEFAFGHKKFIRGNKKMLRMIKRKIKEKKEEKEDIFSLLNTNLKNCRKIVDEINYRQSEIESKILAISKRAEKNSTKIYKEMKQFQTIALLATSREISKETTEMLESILANKVTIEKALESIKARKISEKREEEKQKSEHEKNAFLFLNEVESPLSKLSSDFKLNKSESDDILTVTNYLTYSRKDSVEQN